MKKICPICNAEYIADPMRLKHGRQTTCSREFTNSELVKDQNESLSHVTVAKTSLLSLADNFVVRNVKTSFMLLKTQTHPKVKGFFISINASSVTKNLALGIQEANQELSVLENVMRNENQRICQGRTTTCSAKVQNLFLRLGNKGGTQ